MEDRIIQFIAALRAGGVRVSLAESADAFMAVENLGVEEREAFRLSLRSTLVKDMDSLPTFDELFPLFFDTSAAPPMMDLTEDMTPEEAQMLAQALRMFNEKLREMMERLLRGEELSEEELRQLGQMVGLNRQDDLRYQDWLAKRMQRALQFNEVRDAMSEMAEMLEQMGMNKQRLEQLREMIQANQEALAEQMRQYAGQRIAENMSEQPPDNANVDELMDKPFGALSIAIWRSCGARCGGWPTGCAAASPCVRSGPRRANSTPRPPSAPTSSMAACPWKSNTATIASSPSWS